MTKEMFEWITKWQRETFTKATPLSAINHLKEELDEVVENGHLGNREETTKEYADCFLLLFGSAALYGLSYDDICRAINEKMEINKARKWGEVNDKGYVKHVKFNKGDRVCLKEDDKMEEFFVQSYTGIISNGPIGQFAPSPVLLLKDSRGHRWEFREDSLQSLPKNTL